MSMNDSRDHRASADTAQYVRAAFERVLTTMGDAMVASDHMGSRRIDSIRGTIAAGEESVAFEELVTCIDENDLSIPPAVGDDLRYLAKVLKLESHPVVIALL